MSTAATASPTVARSSSRRQPSSSGQSAPPADGAMAPAAGAGEHQQQQQLSHRDSSQQTPTRDGSRTGHPAAAVSPSTGLAGLARLDQETSNLNRNLPQSQSQTHRRSSSKEGGHTSASPRDGYYGNAALPTSRSDGNPPRSSSRQQPQRQPSDAPRTQSSASGRPAQAPSSNRPVDHHGQAVPVKRRTQVEAQTGIWSLGKTIGAGSMGKVKIAKNTETGEQVAIKIVPRQSTEEHQTQRDKDRADHSKEIRTAREAAIVTLLTHPYICGMRDVVRTNYHWYMLFEYVNGGQMLDYIISHGRLKEKPARKFSRQIASALDYCHRNSIVHRDLKIENILISKTGDIKIIDFGLSNLYSPRSSLKTFCGSLYFAAPELLQARQYTGPEVDVWSFGIVLYVLLCGKVPFDDQSMPQLHAKIKKGLVDYPNWLGPDCKHLISRMLVTEPKQRASLAEVMNHPWMTKGFNAPPENFLPQREPLQLPLDQSVIEKMTGFDFGAPDYIQRELTRIIESDEYQAAVVASMREAPSLTPNTERKRGVFDFYKRRNSATSKDALNISPSAEAINTAPDPVTAFSPLISIYYLAREKQERERVEANPGALALPISPGEKPLKLPDLPPPPEAAYTNSSAYEMAGESATGGRSRPRARTQGEDDAPDTERLARPSDALSPSIVTTPAPTTPTIKRESVAGGLLRRLSTRRGKDGREFVRPSGEPNTPGQLTLQPPSPSIPRKSFSVRKPRSKGATSPMIHSAGSQPQHTTLLTPPLSSGGVVSRAGNRLLGRSTSVNSADRRRRPEPSSTHEIMSSAPVDPPPTSSSDKSSLQAAPKVKISEPPATAEQKPSTLQRGAASRTKSLGHARRESIQARRARRGESRQGHVPEETDAELAEGEETDAGDGDKEIKPVFLKGFFSASTTSTRPLPAIRADIIRVLKELGVEYTEIKGGFHCRHAPSIDLKAAALAEKSPTSPEQPNVQTPTHRRRISFGGLRASSRSREESRDSEKPAEKAGRSSSRRRGAPDTSITNSEDSDEEGNRPSMRRHPSDRAAGETTTHVQNDMGENMVLVFEIIIVKVPLISIHGIQFKKVDGGTWQYKNMAQKILDGLRL